jgi:hypothetical protein
MYVYTLSGITTGEKCYRSSPLPHYHNLWPRFVRVFSPTGLNSCILDLLRVQGKAQQISDGRGARAELWPTPLTYIHIPTIIYSIYI